MSSVRILIVEDYEPFRRLICSTLGTRPDLHIVGESSDGLDAVQKAEELQPDLMVLDIGLPGISGIEVARRIRKLSLKCKILFMSQETCAPVVQEAFRLGALGYVVKERAESELLVAIDAVSHGDLFISKALSDRGFILATEPQALHLFEREIISAHAPEKEPTIPRRHEVLFYFDDESFLVDLTRLVGMALAAGDPVIVIATETHRDILAQNLHADGVDNAAAIKQGFYVSLDTEETLARIMDEGKPNRERFLSAIEPIVRRAKIAAGVGQRRVVIFGEAVSVLCGEGNIQAAMELEQFWNELAKTHFFYLHCAYQLTDELRGSPYAAICAAHSEVHHV